MIPYFIYFLHLFVVWFGMIMLNAYYDRDKSIGWWGHTWRTAVRSVFAGLFCYNLFGITISSVCLFVALLSLYWIYFDPIRNLMARLPFDYKGNTAFLDKIFPNFKSQIITKVILLLVSLIIFTAIQV